MEDSVLTITGTGSSLTGALLYTAEASDEGNILVEDGASLGLTGELGIGAWGDGDLTVQSGATASTGAVYLGIKTTPRATPW